MAVAIAVPAPTVETVRIEAAKWAEMVAALLQAERHGCDDGYSVICVVCNSLHALGCILDAALTSAGFPDAASRDAGRARLKEEVKK